MVRSFGRPDHSGKGTTKLHEALHVRGAIALPSPPSKVELSPSAAVLELPVRPHRRAFELLATQPVSLVGLSQHERNCIVVTAVTDDDGNEHPLSRFGDSVWDMGPEVEAKNRTPYQLRINWPEDVPQAFVNDAKAVLYCALRRGRQDDKKWSGTAVLNIGAEVARVLRHLASLGLGNFGQVRTLQLSDHIKDLLKTLVPSSVRSRLTIVDLVWSFPLEVFHPLQEHPWAGQAMSHVCGSDNDDGGLAGRTGKTPVIPRSVQRALFSCCEAQLDKAQALFQARDAGAVSASSYELTAVRDAVLYLVQITSGMRNSESTGITRNCWRSEVKNGLTFHWVRTREIKTKRGIVDFLVPPEAVRALELLQRYAEPLQARLADEALWLEKMLEQKPDTKGLFSNGMTIAVAVHRLNVVREIGQHLFLSLASSMSDHLGTGTRVEVMSNNGCNAQLKSLARAAGVDWALANHQCRRTFAYNVANSRLGRMGLVFLKWQLKHASMSWTQLYASNPYQEHSLYREMEDEQVQARVELMEGWLQPGTSLSGGAGRKLMQTRSVPVKNLNELLEHTAEVIEIRSTGHAWCMSGTRGCGGQGVYDPGMCGGCSQAIIDQEQVPTWQMIHLDNLRLAAITDCGPSVMQKARRAIQRSTQVLQDLGVPQPANRQMDAYEATLGATA